MSERVATDLAAVLRANEGKRVRITFDDGVVWSADVASVDDEGVLHSGPDGTNPRAWWTRLSRWRLLKRVADSTRWQKRRAR